MKSQTMRYVAAAGCIVGLAALMVSCSSQTSSGAKPAAVEREAVVSPLVVGIDLTVTSVSAQASAGRGNTINVYHVTKNIGTTTAAAPQNKFYLSTSGTASTNCYINIQPLAIIGPGVSKTLTNNMFVIPTNATLGNNYIIVVTGFGCADVNWANNTNNSRTINITQ